MLQIDFQKARRFSKSKKQDSEKAKPQMRNNSRNAKARKISKIFSYIFFWAARIISGGYFLKNKEFLLFSRKSEKQESETWKTRGSIIKLKRQRFKKWPNTDIFMHWHPIPNLISGHLNCSQPTLRSERLTLASHPNRASRRFHPTGQHSHPTPI